jgi:hypothetical protein
VVWEIDIMPEQVATQLKARLKFAALMSLKSEAMEAVHTNAALSTHRKA